MKLKQLGLINWANLENKDYTFADINLISGSSGAGKTTLLDALQTAMTAAMHNLVHFNPGQDEATQHSRTKETRSLASYVLGCDDAKYSRLQPSCGYISAVFHPEQGEDAKAFTALVGACARIDTAGSRRTAKLTDELYALIPGVELSIEHLLTDDEQGNKRIVILDELTTHIQQLFRDLKFQPATGKEEYLRQLYGAFQGKKLAHKLEARNAAKQLVKFMAYKPESNLDNFVRNAVLEPRDLSEAIDQIQNMMKTIHTMEQEASLIEEGISGLDKTNKELLALIESQLNEQTAQYENHYREAVRHRQLYKQEHDNIKNHQNQIAEQSQSINNLATTRRHVQDELRQYEAQKQGIEALQLQDQLLKEKQICKDNILNTSRQLLEENGKRRIYRQKVDALFQTIHKTSRWLPATSFPWLSAIDAIREYDQWNDINLSEIVADNIDPVIALKPGADLLTKHYSEFIRAITNARNDIFTNYVQSGSELEAKQRRCNKLQKEVDHMQAADRVSYREDTERALRLIREHLPDANVQVVCDHIEIIDPEWQAAIEAFMGENRFLIVVDPTHEIPALNLAGKHGLKSALVQGTRAINDAGKLTPFENSVFHLAEFSHDTVRAYFVCAYGNVMQVNDEQKLRTTRRGLMKDGRASTSYKLFVAKINDDDLKLGKEARKRALDAKLSQIKHLRQDIELAEMKKRTLDCWHQLIDDSTSFNLSQPLDAIIDNSQRRDHIEIQLQNLDLSKFEDILQKIETAQTELDKIEQQLQSANQQIGRLSELVKVCSDNMAKHERRADKEDELSTTAWDLVERMAKYYPDFSIDDANDAIEQAIESDKPLFTASDPQALGHRQSAMFNKINDGISQFNLLSLQNIKIKYEGFKQSAKSAEDFDIVVGFAATTDVQRQVLIAHNSLQNNILASHRRNLEEISQSFNKTFVSHLCHTLHNYIQQGKQQLDGLNLKLKHHIFGEEHYEFAYDWLPEFHEYAKFLKEATHINMDGDSGLFGEQHLSANNQAVFDKIRTLLLSEDMEQSKKELKRITDYRNYRTYDIFKVLQDPDNPDIPHKISLKSYGTGSGGQMETPSYVIRAAALSSALKLDISRSNLKTLMIDESFGKMDEARSKAILAYLNKTLGYQILFVIPSKSSGPFHDVVDQVIEITKVESALPRGELHTRVHITTNIMNKERVTKLWQQEKIQIQNQAQLSFFDDEETGEQGDKAYRAIQ